MANTSEWCPLGNDSYRKFKVFDMKWQSVALSSQVTFAAEKYAGFLDNVDENGAKRTQFAISFYTACGQLLNKVQWRNGDLICMDWCVDSEELICVQSDGRVFIFSLFGVEREQRRFSMGLEAQEMKIVNCRLFDSYCGTGLCVLTKANRFYFVNNVEEPKLSRTVEIPSKLGQPSCWTVISKDRTTSVVCASGYEIFLLEQGKTSEPIVPNFDTPVKKYIEMALSPDKFKIALLTENGLIQIISADVKQTFCECDVGYRDPPRYFIWCGNSAAAMCTNNVLQLVSLDGDTIQFPVDQNSRLLEEVDGIRSFDGFTHEFLEKVPDVCVQSFSVGSISPSATLLEVCKEYKKKSYKAYDFIRMIGNVEDAVKICVEAALHEFEPANQKLLLEAASLGKSFVVDADAEMLTNAGRTLRVLNAVRDKSIGIPLTYSQLKSLTMASLIDRLVCREQWPLAVAACRHLRFSLESGVNRVLTHWALKKISNKSQSDAAVGEQICRKFVEYPGVSVSDAAQKAAEAGRKELATLLLENETNLDRQVVMLMKFGKNEKALSKACESGDPDLISFVILHLRLSLDKKSDLDLILRNFPAAFSLYKIYCQDENPQHLKSLLKQTDDFTNHGLCFLKEAVNASLFDAREKIDSLKEAEVCFRQAKDENSAHHLADECKLLKFQAEFEEKLGQTFLDCSLRETMIKLIELNENARTGLLKKEFQISDKQFWYWKIEALAKSAQWTELENFSKLKKPPVGYLPFIEGCAKYGQIAEAKKYFPKLANEEKVKAYIKINLLEEAAKVAFQQKDEISLNRILSMCGPQNRNVAEKVNQMKIQMSSTKAK